MTAQDWKPPTDAELEAIDANDQFWSEHEAYVRELESLDYDERLARRG